MLRELTVRNFAVIEEARLEPGAGLNVLTGQTGAGKSILIEALGFLLGSRGSPDWLRSGAGRLQVTGTFDSGDLPAAARAEFRVTEPRVTLRRELDASGRTRAWLHNQSIPLSALAALGEGLVDFHGQHEHQTLLKAPAQLEILDGFGGLHEEGPRGAKPLRERLARAHALWSALAAELDSLQLSDEERLKRLDLARFQASEIAEARLRPGEEEELEAALPRLKNAERVASLARQAHALLYEQEGSAQEALLKAERALEELARIDPSLAPDQAALAQARALVVETASRLGGLGDEEAAPGRLDEILGRLDRIQRLKKKYGPAVADVLERERRLREEIGWLEDSKGRAEEVLNRLGGARRDLEALALEAHEARRAAAARLARRVQGELRELGMPQARFSVSVEMEAGTLRLGPSGADEVDFLIAPNPGEPLKPLRSVASGGELARAMLALKSVLSRQDRVPVLVFDEVDAGVGGEVGSVVGRRLAALGALRQVLCVTHLPQVAVCAARHFSVVKEASGGRTQVGVSVLEGPARLEALARMLGGREATPASRRHAAELLGSAGRALS